MGRPERLAHQDIKSFATAVSPTDLGKQIAQDYISLIGPSTIGKLTGSLNAQIGHSLAQALPSLTSLNLTELTESLAAQLTEPLVSSITTILRQLVDTLAVPVKPLEPKVRKQLIGAARKIGSPAPAVSPHDTSNNDEEPE